MKGGPSVVMFVSTQDGWDTNIRVQGRAGGSSIVLSTGKWLDE